MLRIYSSNHSLFLVVTPAVFHGYYSGYATILCYNFTIILSPNLAQNFEKRNVAIHALKETLFGKALIFFISLFAFNLYGLVFAAYVQSLRLCFRTASF